MGARQTPIHVRWWAQDELPPTARALDDGAWFSPWIPLRQPIAALFWDSGAEAVPVAAPSAPGDAAFAIYGQRALSGTTLVRWGSSDDLPVAPIFRPVEEDAPDVTGVPPTYQVLVWAGDEEIVPQPVIALDDGFYWTPTRPATALVVANPWADADELPGTRFEDDSAPLTRPVGQTAVLPPLWAWADDAVPQAASLIVDDADGWAQAVAAPTRATQFLPWADADVLTLVATAAIDDDSAWAAPIVARPAAINAVWMQQDERAALPLLVDIDFLVLDLRSYQPAPDTRVFQDDGNFTPEPIYTFTHDSRERFGHRRERAKNFRIGPRIQ